MYCCTSIGTVAAVALMPHHANAMPAAAGDASSKLSVRS